jgi:uncharacterized membrane protein
MRAFKIFGVLAVLLLLAMLLTNGLSRPSCTFVNGAGTLTIKLSDLSPGTVRTFCYRSQAGEKLRFLLAKDASGQIHAVFDACRQCYNFHKGYTYSHGYLVCRLCGNRYRVEAAGIGKASCVPVPLIHQTLSDRVTVKVADLKAGKWLF